MAKDIIHHQVKNALVKDGWAITADPFRLRYEEFKLAADLSAERPFVAQKGTRKIIVEIKSFIGYSFVRDLQQAMEQYKMYLDFIDLTNLDYKLYWAISEIAWDDLFSKKAAQILIKRNHIKVIVVNIKNEEIVQWIE